MSQGGHRLGFVLRCFPENPIYPGGPFALVLRHAFYRQHFGGKGVGQQTLESLNLPISNWSPSHTSWTGVNLWVLPVDGCQSPDCGRPHQWCCHCFIAFSLKGWPRSLVMQDQTDVSTLSRGVILRVCSTPIHPITGWPSLLPPPIPHITACLAARFPAGRRTGLPCSSQSQRC